MCGSSSKSSNATAATDNRQQLAEGAIGISGSSSTSIALTDERQFIDSRAFVDSRQAIDNSVNTMTVLDAGAIDASRTVSLASIDTVYKSATDAIGMSADVSRRAMDSARESAASAIASNENMFGAATSVVQANTSQSLTQAGITSAKSLDLAARVLSDAQVGLEKERAFINDAGKMVADAWGDAKGAGSETRSLMFGVMAIVGLIAFKMVRG